VVQAGDQAVVTSAGRLPIDEISVDTMRILTRHHGPRRHLAPVPLAVAVAVLLAGCSAGAHHEAGNAHGAGNAHDAHAARRAGSTVAGQPGTGMAAVPLPGPDLALRLESLLGQHSMLAADMMRGRIRGDEDFAQAANSALGRNTDAMTDLVAANFGSPAASQFRSVWTAHVGALFTYAQGLADHSNTVRDEAKANLDTFERDLSGFFADASQGRLNRDAARAAVLMHVDHLVRQADAYAARDYPTSDRIYDEGYQHTYGLGKTLAAALLPPDQARALDAPTWRLRSELGRLLAEHVVLVVDATRAGVTNAADFTAAAGTMNGNTRDIAAAVDSLFGTNAAASFQSLWADHIDQIMAYTAAVVSHDARRREDAVTNLHIFEGRLAAFLDTATNRRLDSASVSAALVMHDQMLLRQADAFAAKQYQQAHDIADTTYEHMFDLAKQLADAFGATVAARLPAGGPETGLGGAAGVPGRR
jgi:hypothetical protein